MPSLSEQTKDELIEVLKYYRLSGMFGDGLESEYVLYGCNIVGLMDMTDEELVEELSESTEEDDDLLIRAKAELEIEKILKSDLN